MALTSGLPSSGGSKSALIARYRTAIAKEKNATKKALLTAQLNKLIKPASAGKPGKPGDAMAKYASLKGYIPKRSGDPSVLEKFGGNLSDYGYKEPKYPKKFDVVGQEALDFPMSLEEERNMWLPYTDFKHGGRIKKAKKKSKKSRPKGVRIALRGYGKAMGRG